MITALLLLAAVGQAGAAPTSDFILHEKRSSANLNKRNPVDGDAILPIRIALTQSNLDNGYDYLLDVSDPRSAQYGKHWTMEEIHSKFAPSTDTVESVLTWLHENGYERDQIAASTSSGWLAFEVTVRDAESLFSTRYYEEMNVDGSVGIACDEYHVPSHLSEHIDYVSPGISALPRFNKTKKQRRYNRQSPEIDRRIIDKASSFTVSPHDTSTCDEWTTPVCLRALYGIPNATTNQPENALGVFAFGDMYKQKDLDMYWAQLAPWVPNGTHPTLSSINADPAMIYLVPLETGRVESVVDVSLAFGLLYPQEVTLYQTTFTPTQLKMWINEYGPAFNNSIAEILLPFIAAVDGQFCTQEEKVSGADCGTIELSNVLSVSFGFSELQTPERLAKRMCTEFLKLALKGHTILFASGDLGIAENPWLVPGLLWTDGCVNLEDSNRTVVNPMFPASCPFLTAVGGTQLNPGDSIKSPESAMESFMISSGGGVSNYFPMPRYQKGAVDA